MRSTKYRAREAWVDSLLDGIILLALILLVAVGWGLMVWVTLRVGGVI